MANVTKGLCMEELLLEELMKYVGAAADGGWAAAVAVVGLGEPSCCLS